MKILLLLACLFVLSACEVSNKAQSSKVAEKVAEIAELEAKREKVITAYLIANLKSNLKDPDSAQLRNVTYYHPDTILTDGSRFPSSSHALCGEVNAKNAFGGYVGYKDFISWAQISDGIVKPGMEFAMISGAEKGPARESFLKAAAEICTNKPHLEKAKSDTGDSPKSKEAESPPAAATHANESGYPTAWVFPEAAPVNPPAVSHNQAETPVDCYALSKLGEARGDNFIIVADTVRNARRKGLCVDYPR